MDENPSTTQVPMTIQRLNSYASSSSSSGVVTNFHSKSLSQNLSCDSSRSNFSTFESLDFNLSDCGDLAGSLPSCATTTAVMTVSDLNRDDAIISSSNMGPSSVFVSMSKPPCLFSRHNTLNTSPNSSMATPHHHHPHHASKMGCRSATRSPIDFREGRRASDGLVAQGILHSHSEYPLNSSVAFNSQRLHEACKAKGVLELHLLQKEAAQLQNQYKANLPIDEMNARQIQHNQFHVNPNKLFDMTNLYLHNHAYHPYQQQQQQQSQQQQQQLQGNGSGIQSNIISGQDSGLYFSKAGDLSSYTGLVGGGGAAAAAVGGKLDAIDPLGRPLKLDQYQVALQQQSMAGQKPPLQQQLMQHRLLQQKRQILQKQVALETSLSRRQMLRQQSYKIAQQQQILPPLPLNESESEDLLAFQAIVEGPSGLTTPTGAEGGSLMDAQGIVGSSSSPTPSSNSSSPKLFKPSHVQLIQQPQSTIFIQPHQQQQFMMNPGELTWNTLSGSMQTCQISENAADTIFHQQPIYQVCYMQQD